MADIGKPLREITVEPIEEPLPAPDPAERPDPVEPEKTPA